MVLNHSLRVLRTCGQPRISERVPIATHLQDTKTAAGCFGAANRIIAEDSPTGPAEAGRLPTVPISNWQDPIMVTPDDVSYPICFAGPI